MKYKSLKKNFFFTLLSPVKHTKDGDEILIIHQDYERPNKVVVELIYNYEIEILMNRNNLMTYVERV